MVKGNHLVIQVKNATTVRYTKRNGGRKPDDQFFGFRGATYKKACFSPLKGHVRAR